MSAVWSAERNFHPVFALTGSPRHLTFPLLPHTHTGTVLPQIWVIYVSVKLRRMSRRQTAVSLAGSLTGLFLIFSLWVVAAVRNTLFVSFWSSRRKEKWILIVSVLLSKSRLSNLRLTNKIAAFKMLLESWLRLEQLFWMLTITRFEMNYNS